MRKICNDLGVYGLDMGEPDSDRLLVAALNLNLEKATSRVRLYALSCETC